MVDPKKCAEILYDHFANVTTEEFLANLKRSSPELYEDEETEETEETLESDEGNSEITPINSQEFWETLQKYYAQVTPAEFKYNLKKYCPEIFEDDIKSPSTFPH